MIPVYLPIRSANYFLSRRGLANPAFPINLTFSITNKCQARCQTCHIWKIYAKNPAAEKDELTLREIERIFKTMGPVFFFNVSGGCPFLREDLPEIVDLACNYLKPKVIHIPTNGVEPERIVRMMKIMLTNLANKAKEVCLQIKPSMDGIGPWHDQIRGTDGNFDNLITLMEKLKGLKKSYSNLHIGLGTVISNLNIQCLTQIVELIDRLAPDSYIAEVAEIREEMLNQGSKVTPKPDQYSTAVECLCRQIKKNALKLHGLAKITAAFRLVYYPLSLRIIREKRQVIPCYAALSNVHLSAYGELWPCATLGDRKSLGNVRNHGYNFQKIWHSRQANDVRNYVLAGNCFCPLANQAYANIILHPPSLLKAIHFCLSRKSAP